MIKYFLINCRNLHITNEVLVDFFNKENITEEEYYMLFKKWSSFFDLKTLIYFRNLKTLITYDYTISTLNFIDNDTDIKREFKTKETKIMKWTKNANLEVIFYVSLLKDNEMITLEDLLENKYRTLVSNKILNEINTFIRKLMVLHILLDEYPKKFLIISVRNTQFIFAELILEYLKNIINEAWTNKKITFTYDDFMNKTFDNYEDPILEKNIWITSLMWNTIYFNKFVLYEIHSCFSKNLFEYKYRILYENNNKLINKYVILNKNLNLDNPNFSPGWNLYFELTNINLIYSRKIIEQIPQLIQKHNIKTYSDFFLSEVFSKNLEYLNYSEELKIEMKIDEITSIKFLIDKLNLINSKKIYLNLELVNNLIYCFNEQRWEYKFLTKYYELDKMRENKFSLIKLIDEEKKEYDMYAKNNTNIDPNIYRTTKLSQLFIQLEEINKNISEKETDVNTNIIMIEQLKYLKNYEYFYQNIKLDRRGRQYNWNYPLNYQIKKEFRAVIQDCSYEIKDFLELCNELQKNNHFNDYFEFTFNRLLLSTKDKIYTLLRYLKNELPEEYMYLNTTCFLHLDLKKQEEFLYLNSLSIILFKLGEIFTKLQPGKKNDIYIDLGINIFIQNKDIILNYLEYDIFERELFKLNNKYIQIIEERKNFMLIYSIFDSFKKIINKNIPNNFIFQDCLSSAAQTIIGIIGSNNNLKYWTGISHKQDINDIYENFVQFIFKNKDKIMNNLNNKSSLLLTNNINIWCIRKFSKILVMPWLYGLTQTGLSSRIESFMQISDFSKNWNDIENNQKQRFKNLIWELLNEFGKTNGLNMLDFRNYINYAFPDKYNNYYNIPIYLMKNETSKIKIKKYYVNVFRNQFIEWLKNNEDQCEIIFNELKILINEDFITDIFLYRNNINVIIKLIKKIFKFYKNKDIEILEKIINKLSRLTKKEVVLKSNFVRKNIIIYKIDWENNKIISPTSFKINFYISDEIKDLTQFKNAKPVGLVHGTEGMVSLELRIILSKYINIIGIHDSFGSHVYFYDIVKYLYKKIFIEVCKNTRESLINNFKIDKKSKNYKEIMDLLEEINNNNEIMNLKTLYDEIYESDSFIR